MTPTIDRLIALFTECCTVAIRDLTTAVEEHTAIEQGLDGTPDEYSWSPQTHYAFESGLKVARSQLARAIALVEAALRAREEGSGIAWGAAWAAALSGIQALGRSTAGYHESYDARSATIFDPTPAPEPTVTAATTPQIALLAECTAEVIASLASAVKEHTAIEQGLDETSDDEFGWSDRTAYRYESGLEVARSKLAQALAYAYAAPAAREEDSCCAWGQAQEAALFGLCSLGRSTARYHEDYAVRFTALLAAASPIPSHLIPSHQPRSNGHMGSAI